MYETFSFLREPSSGVSPRSAISPAGTASVRFGSLLRAQRRSLINGVAMKGSLDSALRTAQTEEEASERRASRGLPASRRERNTGPVFATGSVRERPAAAAAAPPAAGTLTKSYRRGPVTPQRRKCSNTFLLPWT